MNNPLNIKFSTSISKNAHPVASHLNFKKKDKPSLIDSSNNAVRNLSSNKNIANRLSVNSKNHGGNDNSNTSHSHDSDNNNNLLEESFFDKNKKIKLDLKNEEIKALIDTEVSYQVNKKINEFKVEMTEYLKEAITKSVSTLIINPEKSKSNNTSNSKILDNNDITTLSNTSNNKDIETILEIQKNLETLLEKKCALFKWESNISKTLLKL